LDRSNVKHLGRTWMIDGVVYLGMSGTGVEFEYEGNGFSLTFLGGNVVGYPGLDFSFARMAVYVDGERVVDCMISEREKTIKIAENATRKKSVIRIMKLSECAYSLVGIKPIVVGDDDDVHPTAEKSRKIEFIGDSLTCGYGVDDENPFHAFRTSTEDVTKAFAYKVAQAFDADYSMFANSGYGIISGGTCPGVKTEYYIPEIYEYMGRCDTDEMPGQTNVREMFWDFANFQPDVIVINLGTNDYSYCAFSHYLKLEFSDEYVKFLKKVRRNNPRARIFCVIGIYGDGIFANIQNAISTYTAETGDSEVFPHIPKPEGYNKAACSHPTDAAYTQSAQYLIDVIRDSMKW